jgi:hypothetical protein
MIVEGLFWIPITICHKPTGRLTNMLDPSDSFFLSLSIPIARHECVCINNLPAATSFIPNYIPFSKRLRVSNHLPRLGDHPTLQMLMEASPPSSSRRVRVGVLDEQQVDRFECQPHRFRIEEPDDEGRDDVEDGEDDVRLVADVLQGWGRDFDNLIRPICQIIIHFRACEERIAYEEIPQKVGCCCQRGTFGADLQREDFGWVYPDTCHPPYIHH